jgi:hypothetical protein
MVQEFLSIAIWEALPGMEAASLGSMRELSELIARKRYARDFLYRSAESQYVLLRYWNSEEARQAAMEDPELLRCWAKLGNEIRTLRVYERLTRVSVGQVIP